MNRFSDSSPELLVKTNSQEDLSSIELFNSRLDFKDTEDVLHHPVSSNVIKHLDFGNVDCEIDGHVEKDDLRSYLLSNKQMDTKRHVIGKMKHIDVSKSAWNTTLLTKYCTSNENFEDENTFSKVNHEGKRNYLAYQTNSIDEKPHTSKTLPFLSENNNIPFDGEFENAFEDVLKDKHKVRTYTGSKEVKSFWNPSKKSCDSIPDNLSKNLKFFTPEKHDTSAYNEAERNGSAVTASEYSSFAQTHSKAFDFCSKNDFYYGKTWRKGIIKTYPKYSNARQQLENENGYFPQRDVTPYGKYRGNIGNSCSPHFYFKHKSTYDSNRTSDKTFPQKYFTACNINEQHTVINKFSGSSAELYDNCSKAGCSYFSNDSNVVPTENSTFVNQTSPCNYDSHINSYGNVFSNRSFGNSVESSSPSFSHLESPIASRKLKAGKFFLETLRASHNMDVFFLKWVNETHFKPGFIDTHCHLDFLIKNNDDQLENFKAYIDHCSARNIPFPVSFEGCVTIFCVPSTFHKFSWWQKILENEMVWGAFGCHPHFANNYGPAQELKLRMALHHHKVKALGEVGLDYSYKNHVPHDLQKTVLKKQLDIAVVMKKPVIIHCRDASKDCLKIMKEVLPSDWLIHRHCFTENYEEAKEWMSHFTNIYFGFTCFVTDKNYKSYGARGAAKQIPLDRVLLETDAPYFQPAVYKNNFPRKSHPGMAIHVAAAISQLRNIPIEDVLSTVRENTTRFYGI